MTLQKLYPYEWPEADRLIWAQLTTEGAVFDAEGALAHLRPATLDMVAVHYGRWLFWLRATDASVLCEPPADRMTPLRVSAWMNSLAHLAPYSRVMYLDTIIRMVQVIAPERDLRKLRRIRKAQHAMARGDHGSRKEGRVPCALDLISAGLNHASVGVDAAQSEFERARRLRDAAMIVFLAAWPIRRKNFVELEIGRSIQITTSNMRLVLPGDDTKTHTAYEAEVLEPAAAIVRRYLSEARPFLLARASVPHNRLWVADTGRPYSYGYIGTRIPLLAESLLGVKVAMHFFRDAVATTFARTSPELSRGTRAILGHSTFRTAERHYNQARAIEAGRDYASIIRGAMEVSTPAQHRRERRD